MGLFGGKRKTYVYSSASRMIEDKDIVNSNQSAVTEYLLQNNLQTTTTLKEMSIVDCMLQAAQNSLPTKWGKAYRNAQSGNYYYGLPKSSVLLRESKDLNTVITKMMTNAAQQPVTLVYARVGEFNYFHMTRHKLATKYGWDFAKNELPTYTKQFGAPVYLENFQIHYPPETISEVVDDDYFAQWGYSAQAGKTHKRPQNLEAPHSLAIEDPSAITPFVRAYYTYETGGVTKTGSFDFGFDEYDTTQDMIMACYTYAGNIKFFTGKFGTGEFPEVERVFETGETMGKFYPRLYARLNKENLADDKFKDTEAYKSSQNFWNCVDVNWSEWVKELHKNMEDTGSITQTFVSCMVPANTKDQDCLEYLFKYFQRLYKTREDTRTKTDQEAYLSRQSDLVNNRARDGLTIVIQDRAYTQSLSFSNIGLMDYSGSIGPVGTYKFELSTITDRSFGWFPRPTQIKVHRYKYQVTEKTYRVVSVYGLAFTEFVTGGNTVVSVGDSDSLFVPLDYSMTSEMTNRDYENVVAKSLHVVVNTLKVVKTKWYQTGVFKAVMFIAAVVMSVWTGGQSLTLYTVLIATVQAIAISVVVSLVAKLAIKLGIKVELVAAIAAVVAIVAGYVNFSDVGQIAGMSASTINQLSNVALQLQAQMRSLQMKSLTKSFAELQADFDSKMKELEELNDLLAVDRQILDNALWVAPNTNDVFINLGESPDDYYTRTIHVGNMGVAVIDATLNSVEQMLQLPTPKRTLDFIQGGI
ncbi:hypothetical protein LB169_002297 [Acinetobacter baumannii]|nr:hypothetical protein [Acinetobacter baumannii]EKX9959423.1 hypothetical protein [Acinetobacter baumannii]EKY0928440.1 hypothetical protein [Acinetobacter baumannii]EKY1173485.1 hypothetical protein [Acinetobacter baumannii]HCW3947863.1 hypothetical protein [Acinetobacter baumannii]